LTCITLARTEGRFARHFTDCQPDEFLAEAQQDQFDN
jgi:hypothetical protein